MCDVHPCVAQFIHHKFLDRVELDIEGTNGHVWAFKNTTTEENEYLMDWFLNFSCHPGKVRPEPGGSSLRIRAPLTRGTLSRWR